MSQMINPKYNKLSSAPFRNDMLDTITTDSFGRIESILCADGKLTKYIDTNTWTIVDESMCELRRALLDKIYWKNIFKVNS